MYCPACREERSGTARACAVCGDALRERSREELEAELAHVGFLLAELDRWDPMQVDGTSRGYLRRRYRERAQTLTALLERPVTAPALVAVPDEIVDALPVVAPPPPPPPQAPATVQPLFGAPPSTPAERMAVEPEPHAGEPVFDVPEVDTPERRAVEEVSTWHRVWKPFLYESVLWFVGAFLVIAGSFYFVALGWSGMTDVGRSLTVFGLAAAYSGAFFAVGTLLCRRAELASAGRVLGLIGAAIAPLAGLSLAPALEHAPWLVVALAVGWAIAAAVLSGSPSRRFDASSVVPVQLLFGLTTLGVALAPALVRLSHAPQWVWMAAIGIGLAYRAARARPEGGTRTATELAFVVLAPAALLLLSSVRLHDMLSEAGAAPPWGVYAPLVSALAMTWLRARTLPPERAADALGVGVVIAQFLALIGAGFGPAPAFFLAAALLTWTTLRLAEGEGQRARWLYAAYAAGYLAYQSVGQLVPAWLNVLLAEVRQALGYAPGARLPFNFAAVYAVPYVAALAWLAVRGVRREGRAAERGEVLLRATAAASVFFALEAIGGDVRPVVWGTPALAALCLGLGLWLERRYLVRVGSAVSTLAPIAVAVGTGLPEAAAVAGGAALILTGLVTFVRVPPRSGLTAASRVVATLAVAFGWAHAFDERTFSLWATLGTVSGAVAAVALAARVRHPRVAGWAALLALGVLPHLAWTFAPSWVGLSLAVSATGVGVAALWLRNAAVSAVAVFGAALATWVCLLQGDPVAVVLVLGAVTSALAARAAPTAWVASAVFALLACVPGIAGIDVWPGLSPTVSAGLFLAMGVAASAWAAVRDRSIATTSFGIAAVLGALYLIAYCLLESRDTAVVPYVSAAAVLAASRALRAELCVPVAMTVVLGQLGVHGTTGRLVLAVALTALALLDDAPRLRGWVLSDRRVGLLGTSCAALVLLVEAATPTWLSDTPPALHLVHLALAPLLGLVWLRASRQPWPFAVSLVIAFVTFPLDEARAVVPAIPVAFVILATRAVRGVPALRRWLGLELEAGRDAAEAWTLAAVAIGAGLVALTPEGRTWPVAIALPLAVLAMTGAPLVWRALILAWSVAFAPELRAVGPALLLALGFATLHAGPSVMRALQAKRTDERAEPIAAYGALALAILTALLDRDLAASLALWPAAALVGAALLSGHVWLLAACGVTLGAGLTTSDAWGFALAALPFAALSAVLRLKGVWAPVERALRLVAPPVRASVVGPLWASGALAVGAAMVSIHPAPSGIASAEWIVLAAVSLLTVTARDYELAIATALVALTTRLYLGEWGVTVAAAAGATLVLLGRRFAERLGGGAGVLRRTGVVLAVAVPLLLPSLGSPALPWSVLASTVAVWTLVVGDERLEPFGWAATWAAAHATMLHLGVVYSTGRGAEFILPYLSAISSLLASAIFFLRSTPPRAWAARVISVLGAAELSSALALIDGAASTEAFIAAGAIALLCGAQLTSAQRDGDPVPAYLAQLSLVLGYLVLRLHALAAAPLDARDGLAALVAGALFSGLFTWTQREARVHRALIAPARAGAFLFPLVGLLALREAEPSAVAAMLVGHAAHFSLLARGSGNRRAASLLAFTAFNAALYFGWRATGAGEPQYYVIPAGIAALVLVRVFRDDLSALAQARIRALAVTAIYAASAWKPLMFSEAWAMILCVGVCILGVVAGIALRIRSFVYLGTAFLVTTVVANLVRFGVREPRMGALFLSLLGLLVVAAMVLFTARRAELIRRYEAMRALLDEWDR